MKKLMTLVLVGIMAFGSQLATAADYDGDKGKGKKKGKPSFVDEKHRAHAEWKQEKAYEQARKKQYKDDDDDRWEDRRRDDERWERRREDERRAERREQDKDKDRWGRTGDTRRDAPDSRRDRDRSLGRVVLEEMSKKRQ